MRALALPREGARERALAFDWHSVCRQFLEHLVPADAGAKLAAAPA